MLSLAALPFAGGLFCYVSTRSKLVGGATAILLSLIPLAYLSAIGGDYTFVSALSLVQFTLLFSMLVSKGRKKWLTPVWFVLSVACAILVGLDMSSASWLLLITAVVWGAYALVEGQRLRSPLVAAPGVVAVLVNLVGAPNDPTEGLRLISPISTLPQYALLLVVLGAAGTAGAVTLAYRMKKEALPLLSSVVAGMVLFPVFGAEALLVVFPVVVALAMVPLTEAKGMLAKVSEATGGEEQVIVDVHFEKAVAFAFAFMMLASPFVTGLGPGSAVQGTNYLGNEELQTLNQVKTLNSALFGAGLVAAPSSIAPWLRAELGVNALLALTPNDSATADAITSTSFRLSNSYLMADDWTPFSFVRTPFLYAFDGSIYGAVLHLDDGTNRVNVTSAAGSNSEDMSAMYLQGHSLSQNASSMTLTMQLTKVGFNLTKQISMATDSPTIEVSYSLSPNFGTPTSLTLPVYIEGTETIRAHTSGDTIQLSSSSANMTLTFPGGSKPELLQGAFQDYVESTFKGDGGVIKGSVIIKVQSARSSGESPFYSSLLDSVRAEGISSLLTFAPQPGLNYIGSPAGPSLTLDLKDAFNRVGFVSGGTSNVESATNARVLSQSVSNSSCSASFSYQTSGLDIQKAVTAGNDSVSLAYSVQTISGSASLKEMNITFWIPFGRTLLGYIEGAGSLTLRLDSGPVTITPTEGTMSAVQVEPDPVYGQLRAVMTFSMSGTSGKAGATMDFGRQVSCQEVLASRPVMNGTDELQLYTQTGAFLQVFSNRYFDIYQISQEELPP
jgi:hypothetical protein